MRVGIGIDFGTSNSAAAVFDGETVRAADLDAAAIGQGDVMPTALYLDRSYAATIGQPAVERYIRENVGRRISLTRERVGGIDITVADTEDTHAGTDDGLSFHAHVHAYTDQDQPGRLFRGVKRWLGNDKLDDVRVFDRRFRLVSLVTPILAYLEKTTRVGGASDTSACVGRPVHYEGLSERADPVATERMREACRHAGLARSTLRLEPIAATLGYLHDKPDAHERIVLTFDFGGGTLDLSLVRARGMAMETLAAHGIGLGGDEINRILYRHKLFPELGEGLVEHIPVASERKRVEFPFERFASRLLNWPMAYELNRPELRETIVQAMREGPDARRRLERLLELVTQNRAYALMQAVENAKLALSSDVAAQIREESLDLDVRVTRAEFEHLLAPSLDAIDAGLACVLAKAGLAAGSVDVVVRTGGSSRIPCVIRRLEQRFPGRVTEHGPFTSIAAGLAIASFRGL